MTVAREDLTADYVLGLYRWGLRQPEERGLRMFIREIRQLFDMLHPVKIPKEYRAIAKEVRTPILRDVAMRVTASLTKDPPIVLVEPRDETTDAKAAASIAGRWLMAEFREMNLAQREDVGYLAALQLVRDSESVIKTVHQPNAWANFPVREDDEDAKRYTGRAERHRKGGVVAPFAWRSVDRLQMLFGEGEYGDDWALEWGQYAVPFRGRQPFPDPDNPKPETSLAGPPAPEEGTLLGTMVPTPMSSGMASRAIKIEYFDADSWALVLNGRMAPGFPKENPYRPLLPYHRALSFPVLYPLKSLVPALDALLTMKMNWSYLTAFPVVIMETVAGIQQMLETLPTGDIGEPPVELTWRPGKVYFPPAGYTMKFLEPPTTGKDLDQMIQELRDMIDLAGIPNIFRGVGGARQAGYAVNQLYAAAQMAYRKLVEGLERQEESVSRFLFHAVEGPIGQTVYVLGQDGDAKRWLGVKPTGDLQALVAPIDFLGPPLASFRPVLPTDEQAMAMIAMQGINSPRPLFSHEYALSHYLQVEDPQGMLDDIATERELEQEPLHSRMLEEAMRLAGLPAQPAPPPPMTGGPPGQNGAFVPNDAGNQGQPTIPGMTQPLTPNQGQPPTQSPGQGGRPAGAFPGRP